MRKTSEREYRFSRHVLLGEGADFGRFLHAVNEKKLFYDPALKLEGMSTGKPRLKARSQFRVRSVDLPGLYETGRIVDVCAQGRAQD